MAVTTETLSGAAIKQSIARVELFTDAALHPDDWRVVFHFEDGIYDGAGTLLQPTQFGTRRVERRFGDIKTDPVIVDMVTKIKTKAYEYRQEDIKSREQGGSDA